VLLVFVSGKIVLTRAKVSSRFLSPLSLEYISVFSDRVSVYNLFSFQVRDETLLLKLSIQYS
jgi:hypothetical protein